MKKKLHDEGRDYNHGEHGLLQDWEKAMELWTKAAKLGSSAALYQLGDEYQDGGDLKEDEFHCGPLAGHEDAISNLGNTE